MACRYPIDDDQDTSSDESSTSDIEDIDGPIDIDDELPNSASSRRDTPLDRAQRYVDRDLFYLYAGTSGDSDDDFEGFQNDWKTDPRQFVQRGTRPFTGK